MGYFTNGIEGADYQEEYYNHCLHDKNEDCDIWLIHIIYNNDREKTPEKQPDILDMLIPRDSNGNNLQCHMLIPINK